MANKLSEEQFEYRGFTCLVRKTGYENVPDEIKDRWEAIEMSTYWWCGYVRIPEGHPLNGIPYVAIENTIECHGGLTYSANEKPGGWTIGFDCYHCDDNPLIQDSIYTVSECRRIVDQIIEMQEREET